MHHKAFFLGTLMAAFVTGTTVAFSIWLVAHSGQLPSFNLAYKPIITKPNIAFAEPVLELVEPLPPLEDQAQFPLSEPVLRLGAKVIQAPAPKYDQGMYLDINLKSKVLTLFQDGQALVLYKVLAIGPPDLPTPKGTFKVLHKEENHFASKEKVWMPWSMHIVGDVFIHGIPYYPDGRILKSYYSHGCIRLKTDQQQALYQQVALGTPVVVY